VGTTKFVILPVEEPSDVDGWSHMLASVADEVLVMERDDA
jgi:hypothetical protein